MKETPGISRIAAEQDARYYPLMKFMMAPGQDICNWREIRAMRFIPKDMDTITLYRGLQCPPKDLRPCPTRCTSWSRDIEVAKVFGPTVLTCSFPISYVVFDTRYLRDGLFEWFKDQKECIIRPIPRTLPMKIEVFPPPIELPMPDSLLE